MLWLKKPAAPFEVRWQPKDSPLLERPGGPEFVIIDRCFITVIVADLFL